jgi:hypothetical protein
VEMELDFFAMKKVERKRQRAENCRKNAFIKA